MKINKYYPFAFVYFFINAVGLPHGMLYTALLTPFFYAWLITLKKKWIISKFLFAFLPYAVLQLFKGVDIKYYLISSALLFTVYIFCYATYIMLNRIQKLDLDRLLTNILISNFILTLIAIILIITPLSSILWTFQTMASNLIKVPRLKMLTYEASYYSTLLVPLYFFFFLRLFKEINSTNIKNFLLISIPLVLSFSMGVISCIALSTLCFFLWYSPGIFSKRRSVNFVTALFLVICISFILLLLFKPTNPFFIRISNILAGNDASGSGRTFEAFHLAYSIADLKSLWWGIGPGQIKIIGDPIIRSFYQYPESYQIVSIPCAAAETLAVFGIIGLVLRIGIQLYLFVKLEVRSNYYQILLFCFIFIYQFTGSFISNIAEYVIWILAFSNIFSEFDSSRRLRSMQIEKDLKYSIL